MVFEGLPLMELPGMVDLEELEDLGFEMREKSEAAGEEFL